MKKRQKKLEFGKETITPLNHVRGGAEIDFSQVDYPPIVQPPIEQPPAVSIRIRIGF